MPKVSVILPSYNHEKYIAEAIQSILNQTFQDFELLIFDDHSKDRSFEIITGFQDERIQAFRNDEQKRGTYGINHAIQHIAKGEYIAIHHSDDVWDSTKLAKQVALLDDQPQYGAVFTNAQAIDEDGRPISDDSHWYATIFNQPNRTRHEWLRFFFYQGNALCHPSVLIRKICYDNVGLYEYGYAQLGDFNMWVRLCMRYEIFVLPEKLTKFRVRADEANASGNRPETQKRSPIEFLEILRKYTRIESIHELVAIFPETQRYMTEQGSEPRFALAMICIHEQTWPIHKLLGYELLFDLISNNDSAKRIKSLYEFDYRNLIALTGQHDVFHVLNGNSAQLFLDTGLGFNETQSITKQIQGQERTIEFELSEYADICHLRFDPANAPAAIHLVSIELLGMAGERYPISTYQTNACHQNGQNYIFDTNDPMITFASPAVRLQKVVITLEYIALGNAAYPYIYHKQAQQIQQQAQQIQQQTQQIQQQAQQHDEVIRRYEEKLSREIHSKTQLIQIQDDMIQTMENTLSWKITKPLRVIRNYPAIKQWADRIFTMFRGRNRP